MEEKDGGKLWVNLLCRVGRWSGYRIIEADGARSDLMNLDGGHRCNRCKRGDVKESAAVGLTVKFPNLPFYSSRIARDIGHRT